MRISDQRAVGDLATAVPASVRVFERHGLDFCCGGRKPLGALCGEAGLSAHDITHEIEAEAEADAAAGEARDWRTEPVRALYAQLDQFERAMHVHVHLENNVVFPRAATLAQAAR